jgi:hypothetical protein
MNIIFAEAVVTDISQEAAEDLKKTLFESALNGVLPLDNTLSEELWIESDKYITPIPLLKLRDFRHGFSSLDGFYSLLKNNLQK